MSRVLIHSLVFPPDGVSTAYIMADLAIELKKLGHSVTVLSTTPHYNVDQKAFANQPMKKRWFGLLYYSEYSGIPVWHVKLPMKGNRVWARAIDYVRFHILSLVASLFTISSQDFVIATSPPLTIGIISWLLGLRWRAPSIYKVAEVYPDLAIRQGVIRGKTMIEIMRWLEKLVYSHNTAIVPIAEQFRDVIKERNVAGKKIYTIPDCVDIELYRPLPRIKSFSKRYKLNEEFVVLYGGNVGLVQDWDSVLFAAETLSGHPIKFVIVGNGMRWEWLNNEVARRGLQNVVLLGYQAKELMPEINASCDIGIIPMTKAGAQDGFPSKVYSNLASGRPVLVSADKNSEMAAIIEINKCGRVVQPEDREAYANAVYRAFKERELLPVEGERGRKLIVERYSKEAIALKYNELIQQLIGR